MWTQVSICCCKLILCVDTSSLKIGISSSYSNYQEQSVNDYSSQQYPGPFEYSSPGPPETSNLSQQEQQPSTSGK